MIIRLDESELSIMRSNFSLGWVGGREGDSTLGWSDSDVSLISPCWSPGVLDEEVVLSAKSSVSDSEDTVVKLLSTSGGNNTTGISLEGPLVSFDSNGDWVLVKSSSELGGCGSNILVSFNGTNTT